MARMTAVPTPCILCRRPAVLVLGFVLLLHGFYSLTPNLPPGPRTGVFLLGSVLLAALLAAACLLWRNPAPAVPTPAPHPLDVALPAAMLASAGYFMLPNRLALPLVAGFLLVQAALFALRRWRTAILVSAAVLLAGLVGALLAVDIRHLGADMLPVSVWANHTLLSGLNPYFEDYTSVTPGPFYYLPAEWLVYLPFELLRLDPRLLNLAAMLALFALYLRSWRAMAAPWAGLALLLAIAASRPAVEMLYQGVVWPLWFLVSALALALLHNRLILAAILLGLLLATNQTTLLIAALLAIWHLRSGDGWRRTLLLGLVALAVYAVIVLPFAHGVIAFIRQNYITLPRLAGEMSAHSFHNAITQVSLLNLLTRLGLADWRGVVQLAACLAGAAVLALRPRTGPRLFLAVAGLAYIGAVGLNVQVWKYYYFPGILLLFWSAFAPRHTAEASQRTAP